MGQKSFARFSARVSETVEEEASRSDDSYHSYNEVQPLVVDKASKPASCLSSRPDLMDRYHIRRKPAGLGGTPPRSASAREMAFQCRRDGIQHPGTKGSMDGNPTSGPSPQGKICTASNGQQSGSSLCPKPRRNTQQFTSQRSGPNHCMGRGEFVRSSGYLHSSPRESTSRSPLEVLHIQQRLVTRSAGFQLDMPTVGDSPDRSLCVPAQRKNASLLHEVSISDVGRGGCPSPTMGFPNRLRFPSDTPNTEVSPASDSREGHYPDGCPLLAKKTMVPALSRDGPGQPITPPTHEQAAISRRLPTPASRDPRLEGLEVERRRLGDLGCSRDVVQTLLQARKASTNATYCRIWEKFSTLAETNHFNPLNPGVQDILLFLQNGLDLGLGLSTLKVQISALSAFTDTRWALNPLVERFLKAVLRLRPPRKTLYPKWDLTVVLNVLANSPFAPTEECSLEDITDKTAFLIAVTSGRRVSEIQALGAEEPYVTFFPDRVVLQPIHQFVPKVPSVYHSNQEWVLPAFGEDPSSSKLHELDVARSLKRYLELTQQFRRDQRLFVIPKGTRRGLAASKTTLASWIVKLIQRAYRASGLPVPNAVNAHSTRGIASSWAALARVSPETICRAASWSSFNTFMSHYSLDPAVLTSRDFGKRTLELSVS